MLFQFIAPWIIGGTLTAPPVGVVKLEITDGNAVGHCTATITKDYHIYSAAHCALSKGKSEIILHDIRYGVKWTDVDAKKDYAIGVAATPLRVMPAKLMVTDFNPPKTGDQITIGGFGCYTKNQDIDFKYRQGTAVVQSLFSNGFDLAGPILVCPGDSGGPAFVDGKLVGMISAVAPWVYSVIVTP